jgi:hypothetical protein
VANTFSRLLAISENTTKHNWINVSDPGWICKAIILGLWRSRSRFQIPDSGMQYDQQKKKKSAIPCVGFSWSLEILHGDHRKKFLFVIKRKLIFCYYQFFVIFVHQNLGLNLDPDTYKPGSGLGFNEHRYGKYQKQISKIQDMCAIMPKARLMLSSRDSALLCRWQILSTSFRAERPRTQSAYDNFFLIDKQTMMKA